jgi:S1-C subfamily serine protease
MKYHAEPTSDQPTPPEVDAVIHSTGTGFIVDGAGHIATASHVVDLDYVQGQIDEYLKSQHKTMVPGSVVGAKVTVLVQAQNKYYTPSPMSADIYDVTEAFSARVVAKDTRTDIAILQCQTNLLKLPPHNFLLNGRPVVEPRTAAQFQVWAPRAGDAVSTSGFPSVVGFETGIPGLTTDTGIVANPYFVDEKQRDIYLLDLHANHGNSGGPVFENTDGRVIGVVVGYRRGTVENSDFIEVVPTVEVLRLLQSAQ